MKKIVIGLAGKAGAGNSTVARALREELGFTVLPFAAPLKAMALDLGFTEANITTGKEAPFDWFSLPSALSDRLALRAITRIVPFGWTYDEGIDQPRAMLGGKSVASVVADLQEWYRADRSNWKTPRIFLQRLGTEWGRERIYDNIWVEAWRNGLGESAAEHFGNILAVADDCRFENEAAAIRAEGGIVLRIERAGAGSATGAAHASEAGVAWADITLVNDTTIDDLSAPALAVIQRHFVVGGWASPQ